MPLKHFCPTTEVTKLSLQLGAGSSFFIDLFSVALLEIKHVVSQLAWDIRFLLWLGLELGLFLLIWFGLFGEVLGNWRLIEPYFVLDIFTLHLMNILGNVLGAIAPSVIEWGVKKINNSRIGSSIGNKMRNVKKIVRSDLVQKVYDELSQNPKFVDKHMDHHP